MSAKEDGNSRASTVPSGTSLLGGGEGGRGGENSHMKETRILVVSFSVAKLQVLFSLQG